MKKLLLSSIILISLSACFKKNEKKNNEVDISSESKNISFDSKLIVENYEKLISKYNTKVSDENWVNIISPNLILIGDIETNRNVLY